MAGNRVLYPFTSVGGQEWTRVGVTDTATGKSQVVAQTEWDSGLVNWVAGAGEWVAWTDQSRRQDDSDPNVLWRVWALNVETGRKLMLSSNGDTPDPYVPVVLGQDNYLFWTQAETDRSAREFVWRPGWSAPKDLLRHQEITPGTETASGGDLVFLSSAAVPHHGHTVGGDCWSVPLDGTGTPRPLTRTGLAMGCAANDGWLVYTLHIDPNTKPVPPDGILDDPWEVRARRMGNEHDTLLHHGYLAMGYPVIGDGFTVLLLGGLALSVRSLTSKARLRIGGRVDQLTIAAGDGDLLAYTAYRSHRATVHIVGVGDL